ncbi:MAG: hypothetical protein A49_02390 [Methyloceanibacter sp.]|nr:MAG: hypothetical protein A49_02390 [Methyloceanibacter sp.]
MTQQSPDSADETPSLERESTVTAETGAGVIARYAKLAPAGPGVYRMLDSGGQVLYVGKARHLKKRVQSYARGTGHNNRIARMIADTASMEFVTTKTEMEALLLEANLIKRLKPRYNVVLRDDKSFPFILIARDHPVPQILKHRGARNRKGDYFGPFASAALWAGPSIPCSAPFCCAPARTVITRRGRAPACSIRSNAAAPRAPAKSRSALMARS